MKHLLSIIIILCLLGCTEDIRFKRVCPETCYTTDASRDGVGECQAGVPVCDEYGSIVDCQGEVRPKPEKCDGLDNNCNGLVDDFISPLLAKNWDMWKNNTLEVEPIDDTTFNVEYEQLEQWPCGKYRYACGDTKLHCHGGGWTVCEYPIQVELNEEGFPVDTETLCDDFDNDCDGVSDEDIFTSLPVEQQYCYNGPDGTQFHSPCRPGQWECIGGTATCVGDVVPSAEICDEVDNDCNGLVDDDETLYNTASYDIVLAVDISGSMQENLTAVRLALSEYVDQFADSERVRFSLVLIGYNYNNSKLFVQQDFGSIVDVIYSLGQLSTDDAAAMEPGIDAVYFVCDEEAPWFGGLNPLGLSYEPDSERIFLGFTDEEAQTTAYNLFNVYTPNPFRTMEGDSVSELCIDNNTLVYWWTDPAFFTDYDSVTIPTGGQTFALSYYWEDILNDLNTVIQELCDDSHILEYHDPDMEEHESDPSGDPLPPVP